MQVDYLLFFGIIAVQDFTIVEEGLERYTTPKLNEIIKYNKVPEYGFEYTGYVAQDYYWRAKKRKYMGFVEAGLRIKTYARLVSSNFSRYIDMYDYMDASSNYWKKGSKSSTC